jgi:hypothetical protein
MALYITLNPRCMLKATYAAAKAMVDLIQKHSINQHDINPHSEALTQIHRAKSRSVFVHFDADYPSKPTQDVPTIQEVYAAVREIVGAEAVTIIQTRGGLHVLVDPKTVESETKNWYPIVCKSLNFGGRLTIDQTGDLMVPVVGCNQGGFTPNFYRPQ